MRFVPNGTSVAPSSSNFFEQATDLASAAFLLFFGTKRYEDQLFY